MKILVTIDLKQKYLDRLQKAEESLEVYKKLNLEAQKQEIKDTDIMISSGSACPELLEQARQLDWIQSWSAGIEEYTDPEVGHILQKKGIRLASMSGIHGQPIAEHVMGFVINHSRRLYEFYARQQEGRWKRMTPGQLSGKTMVIVGAGSIGRAIACRARAFDMKTIGVKREVTEELASFDRLYSNQELHMALKQGDYIVLIVPLTDETRGMIGKEEFQIMKESAFFINVARGEVVRQKEMIAALKQNQIAGAGLDVFEEEPLPDDSPLYTLDNTYITPHVAGLHPDYNRKALRLFQENIQRYKEGRELKNQIDWQQDY